MTGSATPTVLLLHGLGATSGVWHGLIDELDWPARVLAPDLAGHGGAPWSGDYSVGGLAGAVSAECGDEPVIAVGHSLGGAVALCLASQFFRPRVVGVVGVGIKVRWSSDDVEGMARVASRGTRWFATRDEAIARFLRSAGLVDIVDDGHPALENAVVEGADGWRVAQDPTTFAQRPLDMAGLVAACTAPFVLGAGANDAMVSAAELAPFTDEPQIAPDRGHNVHVEDPAWVVELVRSLEAAG